MPDAGSPDTAWKRGDWLIAIALATVVLAVYWPVRDFDFVRYDDPLYLFENPHAIAGLNLQSTHWAVTSFVVGNYMPVAMLTSLLDVSAWGLRPGPIHLENAILHAISSAGWFLMWIHLTGKRGRSFAVAAIFGLHPMHVEPVAWIVERGDLLSMLFMIGALLAYIEWTKPHPHRIGFYILSLTLTLAAVLSKPNAIVLPGLLILLNIWPMRRLRLLRSAADPSAKRFLRVLWDIAPFLIIAIAGAVLAVASRTAAKSTVTLAGWALTDRLANAVLGYSAYVCKFVWPEPMLVHYPLRVNYTAGLIVSAVLLLVVITIIAFRVGFRRPYVIVGWLWCLGTLAPTIGIVQSGSQAMADRYTYLPYVGLSVAVVWWSADAVEVLTKRAVWARLLIGSLSCALVLAVSAAKCRRQLTFWRDTYSLFGHALAYEPDDVVINNALAAAYRFNYRNDLALRAYTRSIAIDPQNIDAQTNAAQLLFPIDPQLALPHFDQGVRLRPLEAPRWFDLGICQQRLGRISQARRSYRQSLRLDPHYAPAQGALQSLPQDQ